MMKHAISHVAALIAALPLSILPHIARACPGCYGDPNSLQTSGMNFAILSLLGFTTLILGGLISFGIHFIKRSRNVLVHTRSIDTEN